MRAILFSLILALQFVGISLGASPLDSRREEIMSSTGTNPLWHWRANLRDENTFCTQTLRTDTEANYCGNQRYSANAIRSIYSDLHEAYVGTNTYLNFNTTFERFLNVFDQVLLTHGGDDALFWGANDLMRIYELAGDELSSTNSSSVQSQMKIFYDSLSYPQYFSSLNSQATFENKAGYSSDSLGDQNTENYCSNVLNAGYLYAQMAGRFDKQFQPGMMNYLFVKSVDGIQEFNSKEYGTRTVGLAMNLRDFAESEDLRFRADIFERICLLEQALLQVDGYANLTSQVVDWENAISPLSAWDANRTKLNHLLFGKPTALYDPTFWYSQFGSDRTNDAYSADRPALNQFAITMPMYVFSDFPQTIFQQTDDIFNYTTPIIGHIRVNKASDGRDMTNECYIYKTPVYCLSTFQYTGGDHDGTGKENCNIQMVSFPGDRAYIAPKLERIPYSFGWRNIAVWKADELMIGNDLTEFSTESDTVVFRGHTFYLGAYDNQGEQSEEAYYMYCENFSNDWSLALCARQTDNPDGVRTFRSYDTFYNAMNAITGYIAENATDSSVVIPICLDDLHNSFYGDTITVDDYCKMATYNERNSATLAPISIYNFDDHAYKRLEAWRETGTEWNAESQIITTTWDSATKNCSSMQITVALPGENELEYSLSGRYDNFSDYIKNGSAKYTKSAWLQGDTTLTLEGTFGKTFPSPVPSPTASNAISPTITWSTYFGGGGGTTGGSSGRATTKAQSIFVDSIGNVYVSGSTTSTELPTQNPYQASYPVTWTDYTWPNEKCGFLAKFSSTGSLLYSTYFGGNTLEQPFRMVGDNNGKIWLAGWSTSNNLPLKNAQQITPGELMGCFNTDGRVTQDESLCDCAGVTGWIYCRYVVQSFLACFDTTKSGNDSLLWSTYLGGIVLPTRGTRGNWDAGLEVDSAGNSYILTEVSTPMAYMEPAPGLSFRHIAPVWAWRTQFIGKFDTNGVAEYYMPFGGRGTTLEGDIALDGEENVYLLGKTSAGYDKDTPQKDPTAGAFWVAEDVKGRAQGVFNFWVEKLDSPLVLEDTGIAGVKWLKAQYGSWMGVKEDGVGNCEALTLNLDSNKHVVVYGTFEAYDEYDKHFYTHLPIKDDFSGPYYTKEPVVFSMSPDLSTVYFSTYFGGIGEETCQREGMAIDNEDRIWITGGLNSSGGFPETGGQLVMNSGTKDAFIGCINSVGDLVYSELFGGNGSDEGWAIFCTNNSVYVVGSTTSTNLPLVNPYQDTLKGTQSAFIMKLTLEATPTPVGFHTPTPTVAPVQTATPTPVGYESPTPWTSPTTTPTPTATPGIGHYSFKEAGWSKFSRDGWDLKYDTTASFNIYLNSTTLDTPTTFNFRLPTTGQYWGWFRWKGGGEWAEIKIEDELGIFHTTQMRNYEWQWFKDDYDVSYHVSNIINANYSVTFNVTSGKGRLDGLLLTDDEDFVPEGKMGGYPIAATTTQEVYIYQGIVENDFLRDNREFIIRDLWYMPSGDNIIDIQEVPDKEEIAVLKVSKGGYGANNIVELFNKPKTGDIHKTELHEAVALDAWQVPICSSCRFLLTGDFTGNGTSNIATEALVDKSYIYWWNLPEREDTTYYLATVTNPYPIAHSN